MNYCNFILLLISALFFFAGTFGHRFERHTTAKNGIIENEKIGEANTEVDGDDIKLTGEGIAQLQLKNKKLQFEFCSENCTNRGIVVCYDAVNPNPSLIGKCLSNQCEFYATIQEEQNNKKIIQFNNKYKEFVGKTCETATMQFPQSFVSFSYDLRLRFNSCKPNITDGNVINLYVFGAASPSCYLKVLQAKKWIPTTTTTSTPQPSTSTSESPKIPSKPNKEKDEEDTATALMALWIAIGILLFLLIVAVIIIAILCWQKQKKPSVAALKHGPSRIQVHPGNKTEANAIEESVVIDNDKKEFVEPKMPKSDAKENNEIVEQSKSTKKRKMKQKKAVIREKSSKKKKRDKVSKAPTQKSSTESTKVDAEPSVLNAATEVSTVPPQQEPQQPKPPKITVRDNPILPDPKFQRPISDVKDALLRQHDPAMILLIESQPVILKRLCENYFKKTPNSAGIQQTMDTFFQVQGDQKPPLQDRECSLFCAPSITVMFEGVEAMIDDAQQALAHQGVKFDEDDEIEGMSKRAEKYLQDPTTPEFVRCYAFGTVFGSLIDANVQIERIFSIPLLFVIVLQRRHPVSSRRKALAFIRRKLPIVESEFSEKERSKMAYPINAIEGALLIDPAGFKNLGSIKTESCVVEDETQVETIDELADESEEPPPKKDVLKRFRKKKHGTKK